MRPVIFVKYYDKGSTVLGAHQMSDALRDLGAESYCVYGNELEAIRNSFLIFIKTSKAHHLAASRMRGNVLVLDIQDTLCFKRRIKNRRLFHGLIFRSQKTLDDYGTGNGSSRKIRQAWDPRYRPNRIGDAEFRLAYIGVPRSFIYWEQLPGVPCITEEWYFQEAVHYNCHISIRSSPRDILYKPTCKVTTAAVCNANLITTRDASTIELLGPDYPYYTERDLPGVLSGPW